MGSQVSSRRIVSPITRYDATCLIHIESRTLSECIDTRDQRQRTILPCTGIVAQKDNGNPREVGASNQIYVQHRRRGRRLTHRLDRQGGVEPGAPFEDAGTGDGVVNRPELFVGRFEERVEVVVFGHVTGLEGYAPMP
jgi:hypothetical protein